MRIAGAGRAAVLAVVAALQPMDVVAQASGLPRQPVVLYLPPTVRSSALNGAAAALVGDAGAVFANPAGLATIRHMAVEAAYRTLPTPDAFVGSVAFAWRVRQFDLGVGARYADFGTQPETYVGPAAAGVAARDALGAASLVYRFGMIAMGVTAKRFARRLDGEGERGTSGDAGIAVAFFDIMALGFAVQNIGGNWHRGSRLDLPRLSRLGFTMNYTDPQESFQLRSVLEFQWPQAESARFVGGGEAGMVLAGLGVVGRVAYGSRSLLGGGADVTYGATVTMGRMDVDWAYRRADLLGRPAHQVGLRMRL